MTAHGNKHSILQLQKLKCKFDMHYEFVFDVVINIKPWKQINNTIQPTTFNQQ